MGNPPHEAGSNPPGDQVRFGIQPALPDDERPVAHQPKLPNHTGIPAAIVCELPQPEVGVPFWNRRLVTPPVVVPETAVHEYCPAVCPVRNIRRARQILVLNPVVQAYLPEHVAENLLWTRVQPANASQPDGGLWIYLKRFRTMSRHKFSLHASIYSRASPTMPGSSCGKNLPFHPR